MAAPAGTIRRWRGQGAINAATAVTLHTAHSATTTVYVTKFTVSITTHAAGKLVQLQDSSGSPVVYAKSLDLAAAAGVPDSITVDFGVSGDSDLALGGIAMTLGKNAQAVSEAAGPSGWFYAEGYEIVPFA